ncbi:MAG: pyruvate kinase [Dethiobacter sp.]|nr:MAG: pyruvate kinase [Dethiobacter sp.]
MRRTKIVCTIGPASENLETIKALIQRGMDVARLNFSHGTLQEHEKRIKTIHEASRQLGKRVGILVDTRGPEIRIKTFRQGEIELKEGEHFTLTAEEVEGDSRRVSITYKELSRDLQPGARILMDDGLIELKAVKVTATEIETQVVHGGRLSSRKGINAPGVYINLPILSKEDERDIEFALQHNIDFIAASFIRRAADVFTIRCLVEKNKASAKIIAKIENIEGVKNYQEILQVADGIMVARGDLGVEIPAEDVPLVQKALITACNRTGKPVITATQMLDSMIRHPRPTRAEASDVANAIFDGTDAVMLSGETAAGAFPAEAVETMARIARRTEEALEYRVILENLEPAIQNTVTDAISYATCRAAQDLEAAAIISATQSGHTARMVSKYKPKAPIIAVTPSEKVAAALTLTWGVYPLLCPPTPHTDEIFNTAVKVAMEAGLIQNGDLVILTAGVPVGVPGTTNFMRIDTVGEVIIQGQGVGKAAVTGIVHVALTAEDALKIEEGQILVSAFTEKSFLPAMEKAGAIITEVGGLTSHAAIVGLNLGKPVIVGAAGATRELSSGQMITVDAVRGLIYRGRATVH